jgi:hypothetical protein
MAPVPTCPLDVHSRIRFRCPTVTSLVASPDEQCADQRESRIWILTSCAPGKRLPPGPQQACDLRE